MSYRYGIMAILLVIVAQPSVRGFSSTNSGSIVSSRISVTSVPKCSVAAMLDTRTAATTNQYYKSGGFRLNSHDDDSIDNGTQFTRGNGTHITRSTVLAMVGKSVILGAGIFAGSLAFSGAAFADEVGRNVDAPTLYTGEEIMVRIYTFISLLYRTLYIIIDTCRLYLCSLHPSIHSNHLSHSIIHLSIQLSIHSFIHPSIQLFIHPSIQLFIHPSNYSPIQLNTINTMIPDLYQKRNTRSLHQNGKAHLRERQRQGHEVLQRPWAQVPREVQGLAAAGDRGQGERGAAGGIPRVRR